MSWLLLLLASLFEIGWTIGLKFSEGFTRPAATALTVLLMVASLLCLGLAVRQLPLGSSYAIWTGIGTLGATLAGILLFGESASPQRLLCIALIVTGVLGLKFAQA